MWVVLKRGPGVGLCVLAACCVLSLGRAVANDRALSGSCPCGRRAAVHVDAVAASALPVDSGGMSVAPLPPIAPPPGTLGVTYARRSWPIPANKHQRIAMLDVRAPAGATRVRVLTTSEYREEDEIEGFRDPDDPCVWHFESKPLVPGIPQIYDVVADGADGDDSRKVRLIRGRRVTLEF